MAKGKKAGKGARVGKPGRPTTQGGGGKATARSIRALERHLDDLVHEQRALRRRMKAMARRLEASPGPPPAFPPGRGPGESHGPGPGEPDGPGRRGRWGRPPWAGGLGPVVSLEVPLETDDPSAPLWATVAARLPEEITTVGDDGRVARYRYSAVGSTPQAPRYRRLADPPPPAGP